MLPVSSAVLYQTAEKLVGQCGHIGVNVDNSWTMWTHWCQKRKNIRNDGKSARHVKRMKILVATGVKRRKTLGNHLKNFSPMANAGKEVLNNNENNDNREKEVKNHCRNRKGLKQLPIFQPLTSLRYSRD